MPFEPFAIFQITETMILQDEPMGSKDKVWCQLPKELGNGRWLFKKPRQQKENIEHLTEKIAAEIAPLIQLPCARVELAEFGDVRGSISLDVRSEGEVLVHGNEIIAGRVLGYDLHKRRHTSDHTFERIRQAIMEVCDKRCKEDLSQFAGYLVFDALIGNTDRHHENWALLRREAGPTEHRLAPTFDHASSLGREMRDERRILFLKENRIPDYLQKGWGAIYLEALGESAISPMELVHQLTIKFPELFGPWLKRVENVTDEQIICIVERFPADWISVPQREFAVALMRETREQLLRINLL
ncbi:MAG: HipA domain-containing protein [Verrucomicrobiota bacterium]